MDSEKCNPFKEKAVLKVGVDFTTLLIGTDTRGSPHPVRGKRSAFRSNLQPGLTEP